MNMEANRQELLKRVHSLPFHMTLTALTSEYCLEVSVVSSQGISYRWEGYDDFSFSAYCIKGLSKNKISQIKDHILSKTLYISDFNRTQLKRIISTKDKYEELSDILVDFLQLPNEKLEYIYCYKNPETGHIYVSDSPSKISEILNRQYSVDTPWEDLDDDRLKAYLEEYEGNECEIPFSYFE